MTTTRRNPTEAERDDRYSVAPLTFQEAARVLLATKREDVESDATADEREAEKNG